MPAGGIDIDILHILDVFLGIGLLQVPIKTRVHRHPFTIQGLRVTSLQRGGKECSGFTEMHVQMIEAGRKRPYILRCCTYFAGVACGVGQTQSPSL